MGGRLTEREGIKANVQVVVNESPPPSGESLRSILEADGFDVVGTASSPEELRDLLTWTDPQVVVFDAGTSVTTVAETREAAPTTGLVVVWPAGVTASVADLKVEPWRAEFELARAVRAACVRHAPVREPVAATKAAPVLAAAALEPIGEPIEQQPVPALVAAAPALVPAGAVAEIRPADPVARRRANLALLFAAASLAVLVLMFSEQLAVRRISPPGGLAQPAPEPSSATVETGGNGTLHLLENPVVNPSATAFLLTRSLSGGLVVQPAPSDGTGTAGSVGQSTGSRTPAHNSRSHSGGSPNGGGSPGGGSGQPQGGGGQAGGSGGGANGGGSSGGQSHGQSGQSHGQSGQSHGQSGQSHGQSGQSHGQSGQSHG